jgi:hypothetical protein
MYKLRRVLSRTYLISKMVFLGFIAAWFFADSPIKRSLSVKETNEGVVKKEVSFGGLGRGV